MHDGWEYVLGAYAACGLTFGVWFWMILVKLQRQRAAKREDGGNG